MASEYKSLLNFQGKVAIVTGAAQGLGAEFASALAQCGATVVLFDIEQASVEEVARRIGSSAQAISCDICDKQRVEQCVAEVIETHGQIDILVSNAGIHRRVDPLDFNEDDVEAIFAVNMKGCLSICGAVGRFMIERGSGSIVNVSALGGGLVGLGRSGCAYGMSKGGIVSLTRDLAAEWTKHGVRVNAVAPGWIRTPMTSALQNDAERASAVLQRVPAGRWGEPKDVARVVLFLASGASSYLSGHTIPVDGGALNTITIS